MRSPPKNQQPIVLDSKRLKSGQRPKIKKSDGQQNIPVFKRPPALEIEEEAIEENKSKYFKEQTGQAPHVEASDVLPPKKSRRKKGQTEDSRQRKIKKPSITKPGSIKDITNPKKFVPPKRAKEDRSPERLLTDAVAKKRATLTSEELVNLGLETATTRKMDWTPVKDRGRSISPAASPSTRIPGTETPIAQSGTALNDYGYSEQENATSTEAMRIQPDLVAAKKRKIDLINGLSSSSSVVNISSAKSTKSKAQTITAKATEGFVIQDENAAQTLSDYFMPPPAVSMTVKKTQKPTAKRANAKAKTKKANENLPVVHSPETAMKATRDQNFVFGTSSQLVREESPTCLREIQQGLKMSETINELQIHNIQPVQMGLQQSTSIALMPSRSLWSAAARNDGSVLEAEFMTLEDTPQPKKALDAPLDLVDDSMLVPALANANDVSKDAKMTSDVVGKTDSIPPNPEQPSEEMVQLPLPLSVAEKTLKPRVRSTSPKKKTAIAKPPAGEMPNYQGFTDTQLAKEIKSFGFKKIKDRKAMITLLEKCWESQKAKNLQDLPPNTLIPQPNTTNFAPKTTEPGEEDHQANKPNPPKKRGRPPKTQTKPAPTATSDPTTSPPKKKRGRPKKDPSATPTATKPKPKPKRKPPPPTNDPTPDPADDIYDSLPPTPSPPRRRNPSNPPPSLTLSPSTSPKTLQPSKHTLSPETHTRLLTAITAAITTQTLPQNQNPKSPTWHERILCYEPILVEELTRWLNVEGGLASVGEDEEVGVELVREWCELGSVCVFGRESVRGGVRAEL